ncbi:MAG: LysR family transcriptional regulator [Gammaproteobacteria bacterium]|nr:LysR family transcriptional regulator [Gammaproteobacteria bacterium]
MFHVIARCGGFSAAQAQLNLSQSAISTQMAQLEARMGGRLCERGRGIFKLTNHGRAVIRASEKLFGVLEDFRTDVAESQEQLVGELRLGLIDNSVTHDDPLIRNAISRFVDEVPGAKVSIYVGGAVDLEQQVLDDRLHIAIGLFYHELETLEYSRLVEEKHMLYCAKAHEFFELRDDDISEKMLMSARYVSWGYGEGQPGWQPPFSFNVMASSSHVEGAAYLILTGSYVGYLPTHYAQFWVDKGVMRPVQPEKTLRATRFSLVRRKSARISRLMQAFLSHFSIDIDASEA